MDRLDLPDDGELPDEEPETLIYSVGGEDAVLEGLSDKGGEREGGIEEAGDVPERLVS